MKILIAVLLLGIGTFVQADQFIQFSDGSTAWRNQNGHIYGKTPSPSNQYQGRDRDTFDHPRTPIVDTQTGTVYTPAGRGYVNTRNGQFVPGQ